MVDDDTYKNLATQICLLTTALVVHREDEPVQSAKRGDPVMLTLVLHHVATLLTTGTPSSVTGSASDPNALHVVAVTANITATGSIQCLLVAQNTRRGESPSAVELRPLQVDSQLVADEVLAKWNEGYQEPEAHYRKILTIIDAFRTRFTGEKNLSRRIDKFHLYIVGNAYPKIAARILNGGNTWERHPIDTLAAYDVSQIHIPADKTLVVKRFDLFAWLTEDRGIAAVRPTLDTKGGTAFEITRHTIKSWIDALTDTYTALKGALIENGVCKGKLEEDEIIDVMLHLLVLHGLLETGLVEFLLEDGPLAKAMDKKKTDTSDPGNEGQTEGDTVNTEEPTVLAVEEEDVLSQDFQRRRASEHPIFRYLKTIVAWYEAVASISGRPPSKPISANLVALPAPVIEEVDDHIKALKDRLSEHPLVLSKDHPSYLDPQKWTKRVKGVTYHAEAILMGLAHSFTPSTVELQSQQVLGLNDSDWQKLKSVFQARRMPIAVSKKCCWCCWRLYQYWHPTGSPRTSPPPKDDSPELFLFGSHSIIYPWCPPPVGIPTEFLCRLRDDLFEVLVRMMKKSKIHHKSGQTSANSSGDYEELVREAEQDRVSGRRDRLKKPLN